MGRREIVALRADRGVHLDDNGRVVMWEDQAMSDVIKPEDVSEVMISWAEDRVGLGNGAWDCVDVQELCAAILNAAIDAGLVSPPVYTVRDNQGNLLDDEVYGLWTNPDAAESQHKEDYTAEHWKGQTE